MTIAISPILISCRWNLTQDYIDSLAKGLPELPDEKRTRFIEKLGLSPYDAGVLTADKETADFFETVAKGRDPQSPPTG